MARFKQPKLLLGLVVIMSFIAVFGTFTPAKSGDTPVLIAGGIECEVDAWTAGEVAWQILRCKWLSGEPLWEPL